MVALAEVLALFREGHRLAYSTLQVTGIPAPILRKAIPPRPAKMTGTLD